VLGALPAIDTDLARTVTDPRLVDELHAFLWTEPFANRGTQDDGWSCRDHVAVVGRLLRDLGAAAVRVRHGRCMFVRGPGADGAPAVGIGQQGASRIGHAWLAAEGIGDVDLSPRLESSQPPWVAVRSPGVYGSSWMAESTQPARFTLTRTLREYEAAIKRATGARDELHAVYLREREEPFSDELSRTGLAWASSRVSQRLLERGLPGDLYARLAAHLLGVQSGRRREMRDISRNKAWAILATDAELSQA